MELLLQGMTHEEGIAGPVLDLLSGCSYADMEQILLKAKRKAIIEDSPLIVDYVRAAYREYNPKSGQERVVSV